MKIPEAEPLFRMVRFLQKNGYVVREENGDYIIHIPKPVLKATLHERDMKKALDIALNGALTSFDGPTLVSALHAPKKKVRTLLELFDYYKKQYRIAAKEPYKAEANDWVKLRHAARRFGLQPTATKVPDFIFSEMQEPIFGEPTIQNFWKFLVQEEKLGNLKQVE